MNMHSPPQWTLANEIKPLEALSDHTPQLGDVFNRSLLDCTRKVSQKSVKLTATISRLKWCFLNPEVAFWKTKQKHHQTRGCAYHKWKNWAHGATQHFSCSWNINSQASYQFSKVMSNFHSKGRVPQVTCATANLPATELAWGTQHRLLKNN